MLPKLVAAADLLKGGLVVGGVANVSFPFDTFDTFDTFGTSGTSDTFDTLDVLNVFDTLDVLIEIAYYQYSIASRSIKEYLKSR